jgi:hypothetical protein
LPAILISPVHRAAFPLSTLRGGYHPPASRGKIARAERGAPLVGFGPTPTRSASLLGRWRKNGNCVHLDEVRGIGEAYDL